ncbi:hypothetical protein EYF80_038312 [Liparis tanakae]|uniref:Uncharacterized protein n=1 Tax=Liparis tanakae TaxID=230148 RepID=A0A4Z2GFM7_9TELE|nr:hypothetical protein EYF80_038312 [Liparis tanakae]
MMVTRMGSSVYSQELSFSEKRVTGGSDDGDSVFHSGNCSAAQGEPRNAPPSLCSAATKWWQLIEARSAELRASGRWVFFAGVTDHERAAR